MSTGETPLQFPQPEQMQPPADALAASAAARDAEFEALMARINTDADASQQELAASTDAYQQRIGTEEETFSPEAEVAGREAVEARERADAARAARAGYLATAPKGKSTLAQQMHRRKATKAGADAAAEVAADQEEAAAVRQETADAHEAELQREIDLMRTEKIAAQERERRRAELPRLISSGNTQAAFPVLDAEYEDAHRTGDWSAFDAQYNRLSGREREEFTAYHDNGGVFTAPEPSAIESPFLDLVAPETADPDEDRMEERWSFDPPAAAEATPRVRATAAAPAPPSAPAEDIAPGRWSSHAIPGRVAAADTVAVEDPASGPVSPAPVSPGPAESEPQYAYNPFRSMSSSELNAIANDPDRMRRMTDAERSQFMAEHAFAIDGSFFGSRDPAGNPVAPASGEAQQNPYAGMNDAELDAIYYDDERIDAMTPDERERFREAYRDNRQRRGAPLDDDFYDPYDDYPYPNAPYSPAPPHVSPYGPPVSPYAGPQAPPGHPGGPTAPPGWPGYHPTRMAAPSAPPRPPLPPEVPQHLFDNNPYMDERVPIAALRAVATDRTEMARLTPNDRALVDVAYRRRYAEDNQDPSRNRFARPRPDLETPAPAAPAAQPRRLRRATAAVGTATAPARSTIGGAFGDVVAAARRIRIPRPRVPRRFRRP